MVVSSQRANPLLGAALRPLNVTDGSAPTVAVEVWVPTLLPDVHGAVACPFAPVSTVAEVLPLKLPPPAVAANTTDAPLTGLLDASLTSTVSGATNAVFWVWT